MPSHSYWNQLSLALGIALSAMPLFPCSLQAAELTDVEIKSLIEQLASTNERPRAYPEVQEGPDAVYPKNYDKAAQEKVWAAYRQLKAIGPRSYPLLMEHFEDQRYSLTGDLGSVEGNRNVGYLCRRIFQNQVSPFNKKVIGEGYNTGEGPPRQNVVPGPRGSRPSRPDFVEHLLSDRVAAKKWAVERRTYTLRYIQCEALEWMIAEEEKDPKTYGLEERTALKNLLHELDSVNLHLESRASLFAK
jgi:hypothetical protein